MKRLLLGFLLCFRMTDAGAQNVTNSSEGPENFNVLSEDVRAHMMARYGPDSPSQARARKMYGRWDGFWGTRFCSDMPAGVSSLAPISEALDFALRIPQSSACLGGSGYTGNWNCIGPYFNTYNCTTGNCQTSGRMMCVWVHPTNKNYILAGAASGGLWKTTDAGLNWSNITDASQHILTGTMGIYHLAVNPLNNNIIYLSTSGSGVWERNPAYGLGLIYSTDGGNTWQADHDFRSIAGTGATGGVGEEIPKMAYHPGTQRLYVISKKKVYVKTAPTAAWQDITPVVMTNNLSQYTHKLTDFEFTHSSSSKVVFSTDGMAERHHLYAYDETLGSWASKEVEFLPGDSCFGMTDISLSGTDEVYINYWGKSDEDHKLYKTGLSQASPLELINDSLHKIARVLVVSPANPNIIYLTNCEGNEDFIELSTNGGIDFNTLGITHADGRCIFLDTATNSPGGIDDVLYCATDGGIAMKPAGSNTFHSLMGDGICITQFSAMSGSPSRNMLMAGAIDNGVQVYNKENPVPWSILYEIWADGMVPAFARNGVLQAFAATQYGVRSRYDFSSGMPVYHSWVGNPPDNMGAGFNWWLPMKFDHNNVARLGFHCIWQRSLSASDWSPAFGSLPAPQEPKGNVDVLDTAHADHKRPVDFIFPEYDGNLVYVAYGRNGGDVTRTNTLLGKLFYTYNYQSSGGYPTWKNITPPYVDQNPINDIEVDPLQPNRLFVAYGGVRWAELPRLPADREARVMYHPMYGENPAWWNNMSKGLPALPINKLLYVEGSDDVLFAATDIGVYRWNKAAQQWECFNTGMPRAIVSDIELNYCSGKLRIATYGRGMWETDYLPDMDNGDPVGFACNITSNTTWNGSKTLSGSVCVKSGQTLTISGSGTRIYMPRKARILVEPDARLIIDGATLTNECGCLWQGIEVMGNVNEESYDLFHGTLELKNGAVIEHAINGFRNFAHDNGLQGGGIIRAKNATFKNCKRAVELVNYPNFPYWDATTNTSSCSFEYVTFLRDNAQIPIDPEAYFTSWLTKGGVEIKNCSFLNVTPLNEQAQHKRGTALSVYSTGMTVRNCNFEGFWRGVASGSINGDPAQSVSIRNNTFKFITENIVMSAAAYGDIRGNSISVMYPAAISVAPYGIYLDNTFGSYVGCNNSVTGSVSAKTYGIIANNTSRYQTIVRNNTFNSNKFGTQTQAHNPSLTLSCNTYNSNQYGWSINPLSAGGGYILKDQGTGCGAGQIRAGNKFINNTYGIYSYLNNSWDYYAGNGANESPSWYGTMSMNACNSASACNFLFECAEPFGAGEIAQGIIRYNDLKEAGEQYGMEAQVLMGDIVRGYNALDDVHGLETFLVAESDDDRIKKLLVPLYIRQGKYTSAAGLVAALDVSDAERQGYTDYYTLMGVLKQDGRRIDALTPEELQMVQALAAGDLEVAPFAKALLEAAYKIQWVHPIEDLPVEAVGRKTKMPGSEDRIESALLNAAPNPADHTATIDVLVSKMDAAKQSFVIVRNINGAEVYRSTSLAAGENSIAVDTRNWATGLYLYSLVTDNKVMATQKLVIAR